jgi:dipeptidase E
MNMSIDRLDGIHRASDPRRAVSEAKALFVGGGNTFRLVKTLQELSLLEPVRRRVLEGMPYIGSSAGSVIAAPTIRTTNDMPIVEPSSFEALALVSFQLNAHYLDPDPASTHIGRSTSDEVTLFDSTSTALQDIAAAAVVYEKAVRAGKGLLLDFAG